MAIYCQRACTSVRGCNYFFEMMDDINVCYVPKAAFTDKDSALFLIFQKTKTMNAILGLN
jgi:hypothetical protein